MSLFHRAVGTALDLRARGERGLSQSTEQAILLAGAVAVALALVGVITAFVMGKLAEIG